MAEKQQFTINLEEFEIERFEFSKRALEIQEKLPIDSFEYQFHLNVNIKSSDKHIILNLVITLFEKQAKAVKIELAKLFTKTTIKVLNFDEVFKPEGDRLRFPDQIFPIVVGLCVSTARGIFLTYTKDTKISNALMPIIDPKVFTKDFTTSDLSVKTPSESSSPNSAPPSLI